MPKGNRVKVVKNTKGQYRITIPKAIGDALNLEGKVVEVRVGGKDTLIVKVMG